jgi:hypothetical protein
MEVLLPPTFDTNLLVIIHTNYGITTETDGSCTKCRYHNSKGKYITRYASKQSDSCNNANYGGRWDKNQCDGNISVERPPKAIYTTINFGEDSYKHPTYKGKTYDCINVLPPVKIKKEPLSGLPNSDYCVIQHEQQFEQFKLEQYPSTTEAISIFLNENLQQYNGEQRYKIIRRQVLLIRTIGNSQLKSREFQELLLVDCSELYNLVKSTLAEFGEMIYAAEIYERPTLMKLMHSKLLPQLQAPIMSLPIVTQMQSYIKSLEIMTTQMNC